LFSEFFFEGKALDVSLLGKEKKKKRKEIKRLLPRWTPLIDLHSSSTSEIKIAASSPMLLPSERG
jgi:hypothetical protein